MNQNTSTTRATHAQRQIASLAAELASRNPDAAAELAKHLAHEATRHKRAWLDGGTGLVIRHNQITGCLEVTAGD